MFCTGSELRSKTTSVQHISTLVFFYLALLFGPILGCGGDIESQIAEVRALHDASQFDASEKMLRDILAKEPHNTEANYLLGTILVQTGQESQGVWPLQRALQSKEQEFALPAGLLLASTFIKNRQFEEAIRATNQVLEIDPMNTRALTSRSKALLEAGKYERVLEDTERLLEILNNQPHTLSYRSGLVLKAKALQYLDKTDEAEKILLDLETLVSTDENRADRIGSCSTVATFYKETQQNDLAKKQFEKCLSAFPTDINLLRTATSFLESQEKLDEAIEHWRVAIGKLPSNYALYSGLVEVFSRHGKYEEASSLLEEAANIFDSGEVWVKLAQTRQKQGNSSAARTAVEKAIEKTESDAEPLRFLQADLLIDMNELEQAKEIANKLKEEPYRTLLEGRIALKQDKPQAALELFETGIGYWPNNAGARYLAGQAASRLGLFDRAINEYREAIRIDPQSTEAGIEIAKLYFSLGNYQQALLFSVAYAAKNTATFVPACVLGIRSATAMNQFEKAQLVLERLKAEADNPAVYYRELAAVERKKSGPAQAAKIVEESALDLSNPANIELLRSALEDWLVIGEATKATETLNTATQKHPESTDLAVLRGELLSRLGQLDEARSIFENILKNSTDAPRAFAGMAHIVSTQEPERAIQLLDQAFEIDGNRNPEYTFTAAQLTSKIGNHEQYLQRLRKITTQFPGHARAANNLAWELAKTESELDFALTLATRARRIKPHPSTLDTLGWVQFKRKELRAAAETLREAAKLAPDDPSIRYRLGIALQAIGDLTAAQISFQQALKHEPFPEMDATREALATLATGE